MPIADAPRLNVKAINWPKGFYLNEVRPSGGGLTRSLVAKALTTNSIPKGTESKYSNTLEFFDYVEAKQDLDRTFMTRGQAR